jgi:hypothetical protein
MNLTRKALTTLGGVFLAALLLVALAPRAARGVAAALVQVTNTTSSPVPTSDVAPLQPFQASCSDLELTGTVLFGSSECQIAPPAGKRLVVQTVGITVNTGNTSRVSDGFLSATAAGSSARMPLALPVIAGVGSNEIISGVTQSLRMYADQPLICGVDFFPLANGYRTDCTVTGYLVTLP